MNTAQSHASLLLLAVMGAPWLIDRAFTWLDRRSTMDRLIEERVKASVWGGYQRTWPDTYGVSLSAICVIRAMPRQGSRMAVGGNHGEDEGVNLIQENAALRASNKRLRAALRESVLENIWSAYHCGIERPEGSWWAAGMSDAEWLERELGLSWSCHHDAEMVKAGFPALADRLVEGH